jgi:hypothetical protein
LQEKSDESEDEQSLEHETKPNTCDQRNSRDLTFPRIAQGFFIMGLGGSKSSHLFDKLQQEDHFAYVNDLFRHYDANGDGVINLPEMKNLVDDLFQDFAVRFPEESMVSFALNEAQKVMLEKLLLKGTSYLSYLFPVVL